MDDAQPKPVYPCLPAPPQRMDVLIPLDVAGIVTSANTERCYELEGYPQGPVPNTATKLRCRTVKVA